MLAIFLVVLVGLSQAATSSDKGDASIPTKTDDEVPCTGPSNDSDHPLANNDGDNGHDARLEELFDNLFHSLDAVFSELQNEEAGAYLNNCLQVLFDDAKQEEGLKHGLIPIVKDASQLVRQTIQEYGPAPTTSSDLEATESSDKPKSELATLSDQAYCIFDDILNELRASLREELELLDRANRASLREELKLLDQAQRATLREELDLLDQAPDASAGEKSESLNQAPDASAGEKSGSLDEVPSASNIQ